jgi:Ca2+-transporting ATPase
VSSSIWLTSDNSNRRLDNQLNIFEGIQRNYFFIIMNLIMIGGQVLIIFKGGQAFQIQPLNGKEWGMSIGLGAISIPWGAVIRLTPDAWFEALVPDINWKRWSWKKKPAKDAAEAEKQEIDQQEDVKPLGRTTTLGMIRGRRATDSLAKRSRARVYKERVSGAGHRAVRRMDGSSTVAPTAGVKSG